MIIAVRKKNSMSIYEVSEKSIGILKDGKYKKGSFAHAAAKKILSDGNKLCDVEMIIESK
jgi:hypothetical protein